MQAPVLDKTVRLIALIVCLILTVIGAALASPGVGDEYFVACCVFSVMILIITSFLGHQVHVASIAFVLVLSGAVVSAAQNETESKDRAGYSLILIGLWGSWFFVFENTFQKIAALQHQVFASTEDIVAFVALCLNLMGCILLWCRSVLAPGGVVAMLSGALFIAAWYMKGPTSMWVGLFWFTYFQYLALAVPLSSACDRPFGSNDGDYHGICVSGYTFVWIAHLMFLTLMVYLARGKGGNSMLTEAGEQLKTTQYLVQFVMVIACLVGVILGAIIANNNTSQVSGWQAANAVLCVVFLLCAILQTDQRETSCFFVALALLMVTSADLVTVTDSNNVSGGDSRIAGGNALMVLSMWLAFMVCAIPSFKPNLAGVTMQNVFILAAVIIACVYFIGLIVFWSFVHVTTGTGAAGCGRLAGCDLPLASSIYCGLTLVLFIWAAIFKRGGHTAMICAFWATIIHVRVMSAAISFQNIKEGSGPGEVPHLNTYLAALYLIWISLLAVIALCLYYYVMHPITALGGGSTASSSSAGGGGGGSSINDSGKAAPVVTTTTTTTTTTHTIVPTDTPAANPNSPPPQPIAAMPVPVQAAVANADQPVAVVVQKETTTTTTVR